MVIEIKIKLSAIGKHKYCFYSISLTANLSTEIRVMSDKMEGNKSIQSYSGNSCQQFIH